MQRADVSRPASAALLALALVLTVGGRADALDAGHPRFNHAELLGSAAAAGLYVAYHPAEDRTVARTLAA